MSAGGTGANQYGSSPANLQSSTSTAKAAEQMNVSPRSVAKARKGLRIVAEGEDRTMEGWLIYGAALNEGREMFPRGDNARFSEWLSSSQLATCSKDDRAAAMWAAANPEEFKATKKAHPRVRTVRGLHAKFKSPDTPEAINDSTIKKVKALYTKATDGSSTDAEVEEAEAQITKIAAKCGVSTDALKKEADVDKVYKPKGGLEAELEIVMGKLQRKPKGWLVGLLIKAAFGNTDAQFEVQSEIMKGL